jgi:hypothetical protein
MRPAHTPRAASMTPFQYANMCSTGWVDREPVEYPQDKWRGELEGVHIEHLGDIPVTGQVDMNRRQRGSAGPWGPRGNHLLRDANLPLSSGPPPRTPHGYLQLFGGVFGLGHLSAG